MKSEVSGRTQDGLLASSLVTSPAWVPWLNNLNEVLTAATLIVGLVLGLYRLWVILKSRQ